MSNTFRNEHPAQERRDIHVPPILLILASIIVTIGLAAWIASSFPKPTKPSVVRPASDLHAATHYLTVEPEVDIAKYQQEKQQELSSYGWIDATHTSAHVPIDRAMQMLAAQSASREREQ